MAVSLSPPIFNIPKMIPAFVTEGGVCYNTRLLYCELRLRMPGRNCHICSDSTKARTAAEMVAAGASDQAIADRIGGVSRVSVLRHRRNHLMAPAKALAEAAGKGQEVKQKRQELMAAA